MSDIPEQGLTTADLVEVLHRAPIENLHEQVHRFVMGGTPVTRATFAALGHRWIRSGDAAENFPGRALFEVLYRAAPEDNRLTALTCVLTILEKVPSVQQQICVAQMCADLGNRIDETHRSLALAGLATNT